MSRVDRRAPAATMVEARSPYVVAGLLVVAGAASAIHLGVAPDPFAPSSATVVALGIVVFTVIVTVGLLLVRGRWARRLGVALVGVGLVTALVARSFDEYRLAEALRRASPPPEPPPPDGVPGGDEEHIDGDGAPT